MMDADEKKKLLARLKRAEGQLGAVRRMIEEDSYCVDILVQLSAARAALGKAGQLLDEMLRAIGLERKVVYIANILKCRPPGNRDPQESEAASCRRYLDAQISMLQPKVILAVGRIAAQQLLGNSLPLGRMRGQRLELASAGIPVIVTYHPAYLLRTPEDKRKAWQDLCATRALLTDLTA